MVCLMAVDGQCIETARECEFEKRPEHSFTLWDRGMDGRTGQGRLGWADDAIQRVVVVSTIVRSRVRVCGGWVWMWGTRQKAVKYKIHSTTVRSQVRSDGGRLGSLRTGFTRNRERERKKKLPGILPGFQITRLHFRA